MLEKLTSIIKEYTGNENLVLTPDTVLITDLGMSSFDLVQLVCEMEETFDIEIPDRSIKSFKTVGDVMSFIDKQ